MTLPPLLQVRGQRSSLPDRHRVVHSARDLPQRPRPRLRRRGGGCVGVRRGALHAALRWPSVHLTSGYAAERSRTGGQKVGFSLLLSGLMALSLTLLDGPPDREHGEGEATAARRV